MKRLITLLLSAAMLCTAVPHAVADTQTEQTYEADHAVIYNPLPYVKTENDLFTGTIEKDEPDAEPEGEAPYRSGMHRTGKDFAKKSETPDTHAFWVCTDLNTYTYDRRTFRLAAEGEHFCIWTLPDDTVSLTDEQIERMAQQFGTVIYPSDTERFGPFRDLGGDGKMHIVAYAMNSLSVCGFFDSYDLYSEEEIGIIDPDDADSYNCLPIININTRLAGNEQTVLCTLAHEFQHLILRSAVLASPANADRLGSEKTVGLWLNEGFSMEAEELSYPGAVAEQGYIEAFERSDKVRFGMSYANFDATSSDVGAYGQSFLFAEYLKALCGKTVFAAFLNGWRNETDPDALTEAHMFATLLTDAQKEAIMDAAQYTESIETRLGSDEAVLASKLALTFRLAILLKQEQGIYSIGTQTPEPPVYDGTGRKLEGGGALYLEIKDGSFSIPKDAEAGLVYVLIKNGGIVGVVSAEEPDEGFYVIAAEHDGEWLAIPAEPFDGSTVKGIPIAAPQDGTIRSQDAIGAIFYASHTENGYRFTCDDEDGEYALTRTDTNKQTLSVAQSDTAFGWMHFADGSDRLQADGYYGRAILYGKISGGFGYYAPAYFENTSFDKVRLLPVSIMRGDTNLDGQRSAADASLILRMLVELSYMNAPMRAAADTDGDGEITAADASKILRILVQLESEEDLH